MAFLLPYLMKESCRNLLTAFLAPKDFGSQFITQEDIPLSKAFMLLPPT